MPLTVDVFYSFRSPYCYILTPRLAALEAEWEAVVNLRPVYPIAIRDRDFFKRVDPLRRAYHIQDSAREAAFRNMPYRRPEPDPVVADLEADTFADEQPFIRPVTRMAAAAARTGDGFRFTNSVMTMMWDGSTDNWHEDAPMSRAVAAAGLDWEKLSTLAETEADALDAEIETNQADQRTAGHWGVPLMVFDGEPFFGQDHFDQLVWRMQQKGLTKRG